MDDDDPDAAHAYEDQDVQWPADVVTAPPAPPRPFTPTPIYDQLVDEHINRERT